MFPLEYKPGVSRGGRVICPISSLTMSQAFSGAFAKFVDETQADQSAMCTINRHLQFPQDLANTPLSN